ncbi:autotransporter domain-containing protein [Serratia quinivorans]|uniref:autotransporter outer membrane beta-barrel domain-containing protein n=1 Tax=Serratia quinivorans TaxID=137545 RepID=UPI0021781BF3|nr:autotransporter outer membrane beta-barrel domain-containing protein [Serratia quinivorans]CAI0985071.1 Extracellular serine protease precursor [Serratia quinivorans]CAI1176958.1 Extracellular serine protease precursor [Serratia quinivorans]CAI1854387.1 Extracellular serine protease precursor [Serratia quinivorans]CAI2108915.1 Extracellular serine protease precursor [Serratia quinivorans]CAI2134368.1 Extracellular serine protease precursor [Serratia quinivorans]
MKRLAIAIIAALPFCSAQAVESYEVRNNSGQTVFKLNFYTPTDDGYFTDEGVAQHSTWVLDEAQKAQVISAAQRWADIIKPKPGQLPGVINVGTFDDKNAGAMSPNVSDDSFSLTQLQAVLQGQEAGELDSGAHAIVRIGKLDFTPTQASPAQIPTDRRFDLEVTIFHEIAHALGISTDAGVADGVTQFGPTQGSWTSHLFDDNGNPAQPGQAIVCKGCKGPDDPSAFDVRKDQGYFAGSQVKEVLEGAMPGVPVRILDVFGDLDEDYMSHIELDRSLMSHQNYRNYTTMMEAELALLQDMGYDIDRRNFYGHSVYGSGLDVVNQQGYFARNAAGTAYIDGEANTAARGVGLHIYGSNNRIEQRGDLLADGVAAAGIRIDGAGNTLSIAPGTRVQANGDYGTSLLVAYGDRHNIIQRGSLEAIGKEGVAARLDFGNNLLGNDAEYRGSYIWQWDGVDLSKYRAAPLVSNFDITGSLKGSKAAIYQSENALAGAINVMRGADIQGDIISDYAQWDENNQARLTRLTFGLQPDELGQVTAVTDSSFDFTYNGNIRGKDNLALVAEGGKTTLNGEHQVYSVDVEPEATLAGNSRYELSNAGRFTNNGLLTTGSPFGLVSIIGDYLQGPQGRLQLMFDSLGRGGQVAISGKSSLGGTLTLMPVKGWYASDWKLNSASLLQLGQASGEFDQIGVQTQSPTLSFNATPVAAGEYQISASRSASAYSQYAQSANERNVGLALARAATTAGNEMRPLLTALDFSAPDGKQVSGALAQLDPSAYNSLIQASFDRERQLTRALTAPERNLTLSSVDDEQDWISFALPYGGGSWQRNAGNITGYNASRYGVLFGAEKRNVLVPGLTTGFHAAVGGQTVNAKSADRARTHSTSFDVGLQFSFAQDPMVGPFAYGLGRVGAEDNHMKRQFDVAGISGTSKSDWTAWNGSLTLGGGYHLALTESFSFGPVAALDYSASKHRTIKESGSGTLPMQIKGHYADSLQSTLGVEALYQGPQALSATLRLGWQHELLSNNVTQRAQFAGYDASVFDSKSTVAGRDGLAAQAGGQYQLNKDVSVGAGLSSELFRQGRNSLEGNLSVNWRF